MVLKVKERRQSAPAGVTSVCQGIRKRPEGFQFRCEGLDPEIALRRVGQRIDAFQKASGGSSFGAEEEWLGAGDFGTKNIGIDKRIAHSFRVFPDAVEGGVQCRDDREELASDRGCVSPAPHATMMVDVMPLTHVDGTPAAVAGAKKEDRKRRRDAGIPGNIGHDRCPI